MNHDEPHSQTEECDWEEMWNQRSILTVLGHRTTRPLYPNNNDGNDDSRKKILENKPKARTLSIYSYDIYPDGQDTVTRLPIIKLKSNTTQLK